MAIAQYCNIDICRLRNIEIFRFSKKLSRNYCNTTPKPPINMTYEKRLKQYDAIIESCPQFDRKGKTMPYTSSNGHMFSQLNKNGELGIRFSKDVQKAYFKSLNTSYYISYGAKMKGYVLIPDILWESPDSIAKMLIESWNYVESLPAK